jgi:hypothetical protein
VALDVHFVERMMDELVRSEADKERRCEAQLGAAAPRRQVSRLVVIYLGRFEHQLPQDVETDSMPLSVW